MGLGCSPPCVRKIVLLLGCFYIGLVLLCFMYSYLIKNPILASHRQWTQPASCVFYLVLLLVWWEMRTRPIMKRLKQRSISHARQHWLLCKVWYAGFKQVFRPSWRHLLKSIQRIWRKWRIGHFALHILKSNDISITVQRSMYLMTIILVLHCLQHTACILQTTAWSPKQKLFILSWVDFPDLLAP